MKKNMFYHDGGKLQYPVKFEKPNRGNAPQKAPVQTVQQTAGKVIKGLKSASAKIDQTLS